MYQLFINKNIANTEKASLKVVCYTKSIGLIWIGKKQRKIWY